MKLSKLSLPLAFAILFSGLAIAQQAAQPPAQTDSMKAAIDDKFRQLDADGDGVISQEEATRMKGLPERFQAADKNKDGKLDRGEFANAMGG